MPADVPGPLGARVLAYLDRAVHARDLAAVDDCVAPDFAGHGFPPDRESLRAFYEWQARVAPEWRIDVEDLVEQGDRVAVRAHAYGFRTESEPGVPHERTWRELDWIAIYRFEGDRIAELWVVSRAR